MSFCTECGSQLPNEARYCSECGASTSGDMIEYGQTIWFTFDDVIYDRQRRLGAIGVVLAFIAAFLPWVTRSVQFLGIQAGSFSTGSPLALLIALAAIAAGIFIFKAGSDSIVMVIGIVIGALALLSMIGAMSSGGSPQLGVLMALAGGGMTAYAGRLTISDGGKP